MATSSMPAVFNVDVSPPASAPEFTVQESAGSFDISGDMNGKESVKLGLTQDRILTIVGQQTKAVEKDENGEVKEGAEKVLYQRAVALPESVDETAISAKMTEQGYLHLCIPKKGLETTAPTAAVGAH